MKHTKLLTKLVLVSIGTLYFSVNVLAADLIFAAPPRENAERGQALYGEIADGLSQLLGQNVVYEQPKNWAEYAKKMRQDYYDIVFDGPHFTAWRQKRLGHVPIASLPGRLEFFIVTSASNDNINSSRDLVGRQICGMPSPHLATDLVYDIYKNPVVQPLIFEVRGGQRKALQAFKEGKCLATILRSTLFKRLPEKERSQLKIVAKTRSMPNQTFSVSQKLKGKERVIANFLTSRQGLVAADQLLLRYSKKKKELIHADPQDFVAHSDILEDVVWGW